MVKRVIVAFMLVLSLSFSVVQAQGTSTVTLTSPTGTVTDSNGHPTYTWTDVNGSEDYLLYLAPANALYHSLFYGTVPGAIYCNGTTCSVDLATTNLVSQAVSIPWLVVGTYSLYINSANDVNNMDAWFGPFNFVISEVQPDGITYGTLSNGNSLQPTINFSLSGSAANSSWYQVYLAPTTNLSDAAINWWFSREQLCGNWTGTSCSISPPNDLLNNTSYAIYIMSWGPGGFSKGGVSGSGWHELIFNVGTPPAVTPTPDPGGGTTDQTESVALVNAERQSRGLHCLVINDKLTTAAQKHAQSMVDNNFFDHNDPVTGTTPWERMQAEGYNYTWAGENIAWGSSTPQEAYNQWWNSQPHRENMLSGNFTEIGIGRVNTYWVMVLGDRRNFDPQPCG